MLFYECVLIIEHALHVDSLSGDGSMRVTTGWTAEVSSLERIGIVACNEIASQIDSGYFMYRLIVEGVVLLVDGWRKSRALP